MTIAQLVSDIKCELACNYVSVLDEKEYGINCKNKEYDFSSVELELFFLENIHYLDIEDHTLLLQRNYRDLCNCINNNDNCNTC